MKCPCCGTETNEAVCPRCCVDLKPYMTPVEVVIATAPDKPKRNRPTPKRDAFGNPQE